MSWYDRRAMLLEAALVEPGYGFVSRVGEHRIGLVIMSRKKYGPWQPGFYPLDHPQYAAIRRHYQAKHKKQTMELPK